MREHSAALERQVLWGLAEKNLIITVAYLKNEPYLIIVSMCLNCD